MAIEIVDFPKHRDFPVRYAAVYQRVFPRDHSSHAVALMVPWIPSQDSAFTEDDTGTPKPWRVRGPWGHGVKFSHHENQMTGGKGWKMW